ncbi:MAG: outer membrane beta-barrel protein [Verrucomicrobiae bacterium]|nr:outer membrane beta-barrel protein [Verrucomicrobiae bacterium]
MSHTAQKNCFRLVATVALQGLLVGAVAYAVYEPSQLPDPSRRWSVELSASAGYDDNIHSRSDGDPNKKSSATAMLNPKFALNIPLDQTFFGLRYNYQWIYYWDRIGDEDFDQNHVADFIFSHRFTPRLQLDINDNFRRAISPELVEIIGGVPYIRQERGDYFYNNLSTAITYNLTKVWTLTIANGWEYWSYDEAAAADQDRNVFSPGIGLNWLVNPATTLGIHYRAGLVDYDDPGPNDMKNSLSHTAYLFLSHLFNPQLSGQLSAGGTVSETDDGQKSSSPYVAGSVTYRYAPNGYLSVGASYFLYTSEQYGYRTAETVASFLQCNHGITPKLIARCAVRFVYSEYGDPSFVVPPGLPKPTSDSWLVDVGLSYSLTRWFIIDANYSFVRGSGVGNDFDRNRVWGGFRLIY